MQKFEGFANGKNRQISVPATFFSELLPLIDDLAELKVTLFCFWALHQRNGEYRFLCISDFLQDDSLCNNLQGIEPQQLVEVTLENCLEKMVERRTLLSASVILEDDPEPIYFMNTEKGRQAVQKIESGHWQPTNNRKLVEILPERPNIFAIYEANIGPLVPLIVDELRDTEKEYPLEWIQEAIQLAVLNNVRKWNYVRTILKTWKQEGKGNREVTGRNSEDYDRWGLTTQFPRK